jgi:glycosyltransferase involved in cell wall biosynthesis
MDRDIKEIHFIHLKTASLPFVSSMQTNSVVPKISFLVPAKGGANILGSTIEQIHSYLKSKFEDSFEIILVPNPIRMDSNLPLPEADAEVLKVACDLKRRFKELRVIPHSSPRGKSAALKTGFRAARGEWIFMTDADLPFSLNFFDQAAEELNRGADFVLGNRRRPESTALVPAGMFWRYVRRYFLSRCFSLAVRTLMPIIKIEDTQAGIKAMTREFATLAFGLQTCRGFYGDLELLLTALQNKKRIRDLPVSLTVDDNKSSVNFRHELGLALYWIYKISRRNALGLYHAKSLQAPALSGPELIEIITEEVADFPGGVIQSRGI